MIGILRPVVARAELLAAQALLSPAQAPPVRIPVEESLAGSPQREQVPPPTGFAFTHLWPWIGLAAVLALSLGLNLLGIDREGYGNTYYAAAVKSMLTGWHNFFFASFDGGGFVTVDKPPVGLWVQAVSAKLFGFSGWSILLPQVMAGVLSVGLLFFLVRRAFGPVAGLLAALALAVTPINVVTNHNNTMDSQLVLVLLLAAWAASLAAERGRLRPLLASAALVGLGYNIKMLQAYPVVPAFGLAYLLCAPIRLRRRLTHLAAAAMVLLVVSLSWSTIVDLTPASERPYVGSSGTNSALSLALGYNGLGRLTAGLASRFPVLELPGATVDLTVMPAFAPQIGDPGVSRLFRPGVAEQASWLLPFALLGLAVAAWQVRPRRGKVGSVDLALTDRYPLSRRRVALVIWGGWLLAWGAYFSVARFYHLYYLLMLGPAIATLTGIGVSALWKEYRAGTWSAWLLPLGLAGGAAAEAYLLASYPASNGWLTPALLALCLIAAAMLLARRGELQARAATAAAVAGSLALLLAPTIWAANSVRDGGGGGWLVQAGPSFGFGPGGGRGGQFPNGPGGARDGGSFAGPGGRANGGFPNAAPNPGAPFGGPGGGRTGGPNGGQGGLLPASSAPDGGAVVPGPRFAPGAPGGAAGGGPGAPASGPNPGPGGAANGIPGGPPTPGAGFFDGRGGGGGAMTFAGEQWNSLDPGLVQYLLANQGGARYLVATPTSSYASLFMLATDRPAMALGGYQGWDRILTPTELAQQVADGVVRFFWLSGQGAGRGGPSGQNATADLEQMVRASCAVVTATQWQYAPGNMSAEPGAGTSAPGPNGTGGRGFFGGPQGSLQLYDCAGAPLTAAASSAA